MKSESKMQIQTGTARLDTSKISRIEIINHAGTSQFIKFGMAFTAYKELGDFNQLTISLQDGGQTIKIFLD